ncbi:hypothetical protein MPSEU_000836900 [Mayamaea pseudoterrestris]|nr:hypothetical protein MPSEU_000836900 [Mayamaea pseudoterrestris]
MRNICNPMDSNARLVKLLLVLAFHSTFSLSSSIFQSTRTSTTNRHVAEASDRRRGWIQPQTAMAATDTYNVKAAVATTDTKPSVHMQLNPPALTSSSATEQLDAPTEPSPPSKDNSRPTIITVHSFKDMTGKEWKALNTSKRKFLAFLQYHQISALMSQIETKRYTSQPKGSIESTRQEPGTCQMSSSSDIDNTDAVSDFESTIPYQRDEWRRLWKLGRLLTDRTELLAVYPSDYDQSSNSENDSPASTTQQYAAARSRGGFTDLLGLYTDRLSAILQDELEQDATSGKHNNKNDSTSLLLAWLQKHYGYRNTMRLVNNGADRSETELKKHWKHFLEWFRREFPYYYDRCETCGASMKEQNAACQDQDAIEPVAIETLEHHDDETDDDHPTFIGYIYPTSRELDGKASRTELYRCHKCSSFTRFPRFNSARHVLESRRGRCGEYSMLLYRILRALNYHCRWVVDWADHVWAEVAMEDADGVSRWVHLDPCEAAVDENLLYQGWGKKQTYILAFYAPPLNKFADVTFDDELEWHHISMAEHPLIEDVTQSYTSDSWETINQRRDESPEQVHTAIHRATSDLHQKLASYYHVD